MHGRARVRWATAMTMGLLLAGVVASPGMGALSPNHSILLYKPGKAMTGVLKSGVFTRKRTLELKSVGLAVATRDSLALYSKGTGRLRTGRFRGGVYTPVEAITIRPGFTHAAGGCDTIVLYNELTGRLLTGTLVAGRFRNRTSTTIDTGWTNLTASCDTLWISHAGTQDSVFGSLSGGDFIPRGPSETDSFAFPLQGASADSVMTIAGGFGLWGTLTGGDRSLMSDSDSFTPDWDIVAGTARSLQFYRSDGLQARGTFSGGVWAQVGSGNMAAGWTIIVGGR